MYVNLEDKSIHFNTRQVPLLAFTQIRKGLCSSLPVDYSLHVKIRNSDFAVLGVYPFTNGKLFSTCIPWATIIGMTTMYVYDERELSGKR